jgi:hypothetical protein
MVVPQGTEYTSRIRQSTNGRGSGRLHEPIARQMMTGGVAVAPFIHLLASSEEFHTPFRRLGNESTSHLGFVPDKGQAAKFQLYLAQTDTSAMVVDHIGVLSFGSTVGLRVAFARLTGWLFRTRRRSMDEQRNSIGSARPRPWDTGGHPSFIEYYAQESLSERTLQRYMNIRDAVLRVLHHPKPGLRVVDIGCGAGAQCGLWVESGHQVSGIDINQQLIELARERAMQAGLDVDFEVIRQRICPGRTNQSTSA